MLKAIIFDMDGILIDSEPAWEAAKFEVMQRLCGIKITKADADATVGKRVEDIAYIWCKQFNLAPEKAADIAAAMNKAVIYWIQQHGEALPGVQGALQWLQANGFKVALASSSNMQVIDTVIDTLQLRHYFISLNSANELPYGKPHPMVYLNTAEKLGLSPLECLAIEDSVNGVIAAKAAQMEVIAIPPQELQHDPRYRIADRQLDSLLELPALLHGRLAQSAV
ncbi:hexitol phosphatase HxpB [Pasteurella testudinis]|uniref:hexitol phosphatase HxpB n=1 Tax=Pasteurella testudinis TaxID=761 RepID=UPI004058B79C